jgi:hypothetical protein
MKCVVCHGESIETREVKEPIEVGSDVLYVTVMIPVCQTCRERCYDRKTVPYFETAEAEVRVAGAKGENVVARLDDLALEGLAAADEVTDAFVGLGENGDQITVAETAAVTESLCTSSPT